MNIFSWLIAIPQKFEGAFYHFSFHDIMGTQLLSYPAFLWNCFNTQLLQMKWLSDTVFLITQKILRLDMSSPLGKSVHFFIYDTVKIFILLSVLIFLISLVQSYFPPERTKKILGRFGGIGGNIMGALLGTITPFCSCSSIPIFMGFTQAGLPLGITFSFLISSPLVDLAAFMLLLSIFGMKLAVVYAVVGIILAVIGGTIIQKLKMEKYIADFITQKAQPLCACDGGCDSSDADGAMPMKERFSFSLHQVLDIIKRVWLYILIGVGIGAAIHNYIPTSFIEFAVGQKNPFSVLIATLVGVPMYADIFGTIPISEALYAKGVGAGTIMSFMMAVTALSTPSIIMLSKVVKAKLLWTFVGIVTAGIIVIGYTFNAFGFIFY